MGNNKNTALAAAIARSGLTAREIARRAGISETTLSLALNGHRSPRLETALKLGHVLGALPEDIGMAGIQSVTADKEVVQC